MQDICFILPSSMDTSLFVLKLKELLNLLVSLHPALCFYALYLFLIGWNLKLKFTYLPSCSLLLFICLHPVHIHLYISGHSYFWLIYIDRCSQLLFCLFQGRFNSFSDYYLWEGLVALKRTKMLCQA